MNGLDKIKLEKIEIKKILDFLKSYNQNNDNLNLKKDIEDAIKNVFKLEMQELGVVYDKNNTNQNEIELNVNDDPTYKLAGGLHFDLKTDSNGKKYYQPTVNINTHDMFKTLQDNNNEMILLNYKMLFHTLFHEIQHIRQQISAAMFSESSKKVLAFSRELALQSILGHEFTDENYDNLVTEIDADEFGYMQYLEIMDSDDDIQKLKDIETGKNSIAKFKITLESNGKPTKKTLLRDEATISKLDELILEPKNTLFLLKKFPILRKEYNEDGSRKSSIELVRNMNLENTQILNNSNISNIDKKRMIKNSKEMYYELLYRSFEKEHPEQLKKFSSEYGENETLHLFARMKNYFDSELSRNLKNAQKMQLALNTSSIKPVSYPSNDEIQQSKREIITYYSNKKKNLDIMKIQAIGPYIPPVHFNHNDEGR